MTLAVNVIGKECLVMGIDSRETFTFQHQNGENFTVYQDDKEKIHILPSKFVVSFVGTSSIAAYDDSLNDIKYRYVDINHSILGLTDSKYSKILTFEDIISYFKKRVPITYNDFDSTEIFIGGYNNTCGIQYLNFSKGQLQKSWYCLNSGLMTIRGSYQYEAASFVKEYFNESKDTNMNDIAEKYIKNLNEEESVKLCRSTIDYIIKFCSRLEQDKQAVGGNIKIIVVDKQGVRPWQQEDEN